MPNTPVGIVFLYSFMDEDDADVNMSLIKDGNIKSVYVPSHIIIILDNGRIINTDREFATSYYSAAHSGISSEELVTLINHGNWNSMFNRKYIPSIQKVLGISLQDIYY